MGLHSFSQNVPWPIAAEVDQDAHVIFSTPQPLSAHASVMMAGRTLSRFADDRQSATTPGAGADVDGAGLGDGGVAGVVAGDEDVVAGRGEDADVAPLLAALADAALWPAAEPA